MNILKQFYLALALMMAFPCQGQAQVGRIELHTFQSATLTDEEFLTGKKNASTVTIAGELRFPRQKMQRFPVVILVHGSGGVSGYVDDWAHELNAMGVAVFILDSFTGRGLYKVNNDQSQLGRLTMIVDAYRALDLLTQHKRIDAARIALMGFSRGGQVTLYASLKRFQQLHGSVSGHEFAAYIPFYPSCITHYKGEEDIANRPVRIFHGRADNYNPVAPCRTYVERLRKKGKDVVLHEYAGAHHVFDYKKLSKPVILAKAQTTRACALEETRDGTIVNTQSGKQFTYSDPCVEHGPTIAFNQDAYDKAKQALHYFISTIFLTVKKPQLD
jgi:dienelactone hydrolase